MGFSKEDHGAATSNEAQAGGSCSLGISGQMHDDEEFF
jgi:hypothetical protein